MLMGDGDWGKNEHEGLGRSRRGNDREEEQGKYLDKGSHYVVSEKLGTRDITRNIQG